MANWLTYRIRVGDDVLVLADEEAREMIENETERSKKADAQTASFLESTTTNGIIRNGKSDPFGQTAIGGMQVVIDKGDLIINGNIKNHTRLTRTYNVTQENRTEVFLYRFDSVTNEITGLWRDCIIQGEIILSREDKTELPLRSSGYYDILICKITIPAGATEITQDMIGDFRQNEYYCGYAKNILVEIDETLTKSDAAADAAAVGTVISDLRNETRARDIITGKRITNLEAGLPVERWSVDDSFAYIKDVPKNALPFASVDMVGGMTRKSRNLLCIRDDVREARGFTITPRSDGSYVLNGTRTADGAVTNQITLNNPLPAGTYTISLNNSEVVGDSTQTGSVRVWFLLSDGTYLGNCAANVKNRIVTITSDLPVKSAVIRIGENIQSLDNFVIRPQVEAGDAATEFDPYFEGLRSAPVTEVESVGVNLYSFGDKAIDGFQLYYFEKALPAGTYTVSALVSSTDTDDTRTSLVFMNENEALAYAHMKRDVYNSVTITTTREATSIRILSSTSVAKSEGDSSTWQNVMICKGETSLPYTPYRRNTLPVPAAVQALDGYGWGINADYYTYIDLRKKQFVKRVVKKVFDGTEKWENSGDAGSANNYCVYKAGEMGSVVNLVGICNRYTRVTVTGNNTSVGFNVLNSPAYNKAVISIRPENTETMDATKMAKLCATWYAEGNPLTVYYALAEPIITDISDLLSDDNLIRVEGGGTVTMVNEYGYDVPSEITYQMKGAET